MKSLILCLGLSLVVVVPALAADAPDGKAIFEKACASCHGADGSRKLGEAPLKDLKADEILTKLQGYAAGTFGGERKQTMERIAKQHGADELKAVADYAGTL